jgi:integrase
MVQTPRRDGPRDRRRGGKEAARTVLAVFRKMIAWGIAEELLRRRDNPASGWRAICPRSARRSACCRSRRVVWQAAQTLGFPFGPAYQLILLTGCRPGEWARTRRQWIDLKQNLCVIPAERYKSDHVHVVPLVDEAVKILIKVMMIGTGTVSDSAAPCNRRSGAQSGLNSARLGPARGLAPRPCGLQSLPDWRCGQGRANA